jgi:hypothetical protein
MSTELVSAKEARIATSLKSLNKRELDAYKYAVDMSQPDVKPEMAEEMYSLFASGSTCEGIRRQMVSYSLGQVVVARVTGNWDGRLAEYRAILIQTIPERAAQTQLESVELVSAMLQATNKKWIEKIKQYIATGDDKLLEGIPLPKTIKDVQALVELFLKMTGQEKKRIEVTGGLTVDHQGAAAAVTAEDADKVMKELLGEVTDAEFTDAEDPE